MRQSGEKNGALNPVVAIETIGLYAACALLFCISLLATIYFCRSMSEEMNMPGGWGMSMMWMRMPGQTWAAYAFMFLSMWIAMMAAMMLPSAMPMLRAYHIAPKKRMPARAVLGVLCGYLTLWLGVGIMVYAIGYLWAQTTMHSGRLSQLVPALMGAMLVASGFIQFTRWKMNGLARCRNPFPCVAGNLDQTKQNAFREGINQGVSCFACSSGPMLILLALGMMNLAVMTLVTLVITLEKLLPQPKYFVRLTGVIAIGTGLLMIIKHLS